MLLIVGIPIFIVGLLPPGWTPRGTSTSNNCVFSFSGDGCGGLRERRFLLLPLALLLLLYLLYGRDYEMTTMTRSQRHIHQRQRQC